ncbi:lysylphosphatidylglycerol synthase domain-containing protein [Pseudomonas sp. UBA4194]|uniref:lysylphosphatidylglycerol synthase domain-containing protein n=1 Tax=Pseudomonas sp. UBA4194 TaxID=1947317 RepID=UPI0025F0A1AB|nr:lysylphosphatidylglycerol synthase domain-containing protein [Pseudomonas sp. UBA4194]
MNSADSTAGQPKKRASKWVWAKRAMTLFCFILVPVLLFLLVKNLDWQEVRHALGSYKLSTLLIGAGIALTSYLVFASYDVLARRYTGHKVPVTQVMPLAFVCYAFNLNLSSWVGGIALRYRLYSKLGLDVPTITRILSMCLITNWLGYMFIAGTVFAMGLPELPEGYKIGSTGLRVIGVVIIALGLVYLLACRFAKKRTWTVRDQEITLPSFKVAASQALLGALNWALMGALVWSLLPEKVGYPTILAILLISSIAGVIAHIPAGLGVLETIFITLLQGQYSKGTLLAALIAYRALYFLMPLAIACVVYLVVERRTRDVEKRRESNAHS